MSWHLVDGVPLPDALGGHPALDFCNTRAGWSADGTAAPPKEYLTSPRALALWAVDAGLLPAAPRSPVEAHLDDRLALARALAFRESLYTCLVGRAADDDWRLVSREIAASRAVSTLHPTVDGPARWRLDPPAARSAPSTGAASAALQLAAGAAEELLTGPLGARVAACPGVGCGWLFADPRQRRRWCSMAVCGNRAKARRHAARRQDA